MGRASEPAMRTQTAHGTNNDGMGIITTAFVSSVVASEDFNNNLLFESNGSGFMSRGTVESVCLYPC
jgi:hypothetical protein